MQRLGLRRLRGARVWMKLRGLRLLRGVQRSHGLQRRGLWRSRGARRSHTQQRPHGRQRPPLFEQIRPALRPRKPHIAIESWIVWRPRDRRISQLSHLRSVRSDPPKAVPGGQERWAGVRPRLNGEEEGGEKGRGTGGGDMGRAGEERGGRGGGKQGGMVNILLEAATVGFTLLRPLSGRPNSAPKSGPDSANVRELGRAGPKSGRHLPKRGQARPNSARDRPKLACCRPNLVEVANSVQVWQRWVQISSSLGASLVEIGTPLAEVSQNQQKLAIWPELAQMRPKLPEFGRDRAQFGRSLGEPGRNRAGLAQIWPKLI